MHAEPKIGTECRILWNDLPFDPQADDSVSISRVENELQNSDVKVSRVFLTYKGSREDKVFYHKLPPAITGPDTSKFVLLRNPSTYPDGKETIIGQVLITTLGGKEPEFVTYNQCTHQEKCWILERLPSQGEGSCTLY